MPRAPREEIVAFLARATRLDLGDVPPDADIYHDLGVNSLQAMRVLAMLQERFGIQLHEASAMNVRTLGELLDMVEDAIDFQGG